MVTLLSPAKVRAGCTKDTECTNHNVCVRGQCVSPVDPGSGIAAGTLAAGDGTRRACTQKCDQAYSKCLSRIRSVSACVARFRNDCADKCEGTGKTAKVCQKQCGTAELRMSWEPDCAKQGDAARASCLTNQQHCLGSCGTSS